MESPEIYRIPFSGTSMQPFFQDTRSVWIDFSKTQKPKVGDVLVYQCADKDFVCHRVIGIEKDSFCLKGDNSPWSENISQKMHWGRVVAYEKNGEKHPIQNHFLIKPYCWVQMGFQKISFLLARKVAHKVGRVYLRIVKLFC